MASVAYAYRVLPLCDGLPFGATVAGLKREHLGDAEVRRNLNDLWIEHGVLLLRRGEDQP